VSGVLPSYSSPSTLSPLPTLHRMYGYNLRHVLKKRKNSTQSLQSDVIRVVSLKMQRLSLELNLAQNGESGSSNTSRTFADSSAVSGPAFEKYIFFPTCDPLTSFGPQNCWCRSQQVSTELSFSTAGHTPLFFFFYFHLDFFHYNECL